MDTETDSCDGFGVAFSGEELVGWDAFGEWGVGEPEVFNPWCKAHDRPPKSLLSLLATAGASLLALASLSLSSMAGSLSSLKYGSGML